MLLRAVHRYNEEMRANVKPLTHWAIYKGYKMRILQRAADEVSGIFTTADGQVPFRYDAIGMVVYLEEQPLAINEYGWEIAQAATKSEQ